MPSVNVQHEMPLPLHGRLLDWILPSSKVLTIIHLLLTVNLHADKIN